MVQADVCACDVVWVRASSLKVELGNVGILAYSVFLEATETFYLIK